MDRRDRQDNPLIEWAKKIRAQWAQAQRAIFGAPPRPPRTEVPDYRSVGPRRIDNPFRPPDRDVLRRDVIPPATPMVATPPDWLTRRPERMDENDKKKFNKRRNPNMQ